MQAQTMKIDKTIGRSEMQATTSKLVRRLKGIAAQIDSDFKDVGSQLQVNQEISSLVGRIRDHDSNITGAEVSKLKKAIDNGSLYVNKQPVEQKTTELEGIYADFLAGLDGLMKEFTNVHSSILNGSHRRTATQESNVQSSCSPNKAEQPIGNEKVTPAKTKSNKKTSQKNKIEVAPLPKPQVQLHFIKIADIKPGQQNFHFVAKITKLASQVYPTQTGKSYKIKCELGDETGIINGTFPQTKGVEVGKTYEFRNLTTKTRKGITLFSEENCIFPSERTITQVNEKVNMSQK